MKNGKSSLWGISAVALLAGWPLVSPAAVDTQSNSPYTQSDFSSRSTILEAQKLLRANGFTAVTETSELDQRTSSALRQFQARNWLMITGTLDPDTMRALKANVPSQAAP
jgi:hypothetical protein